MIEDCLTLVDIQLHLTHSCSMLQMVLGSGNNESYQKFSIFLHSCFASMSPMPVERWGHFCGLVSTEQGPEVIVSGGYSYPDFVDSVHIYNVDTDTWREGNETQSIWGENC